MFVQMIDRTIHTFFCLVCLLLANVASAQPAKKYALLIGVTNYQHARMNENPLKYPEDDAKAVGELLKRSDYNVEVLLGKAATKKAIESALAKAGKQGSSGGVVLIGLFGHGVQYGADAYFCPYDSGVRTVKLSDGTTARNDNGQPKLEPDPESLVTMRTILDPLTTCGATNRVLMADCCREDPNRARGRNPFGTSLRVNDIPRGTLALFACSEKEQAFEHDDWKHGAFTYAFLKHAEELAQTGRVTSGSLTDRMYETVRKLVKDKTNGRETQTVYDIDNGRVEFLLKPNASATETDSNISKNPDLDGEKSGNDMSRTESNSARSRMPQFFDALKGASKSEAVSSQREWAKYLGTEVQIKNRIGMEFVLIPPGEFMMGSREDEKDRTDSEGPRHLVKLSQPYFLGTHEVTQKQWREVMGSEPWLDEDGEPRTNVKTGNDYPATYMSWDDTVAFCKKLSDREGVDYRLPTEAEWEYACRGGTTTVYSFGDSAADLSQYAWYTKNAWDERYAHRVGQKRSNPFGLHDMPGNVWEWCSDWYGDAYYGKSSSIDPQGPKTGSRRVYRGGSWRDDPGRCRSAGRGGNSPDSRGIVLGIRVLRSSVPAGK